LRFGDFLWFMISYLSISEDGYLYGLRFSIYGICDYLRFILWMMQPMIHDLWFMVAILQSTAYLRNGSSTWFYWRYIISRWSDGTHKRHWQLFFCRLSK
jgi:hypothetical protein